MLIKSCKNKKMHLRAVRAILNSDVRRYDFQLLSKNCNRKNNTLTESRVALHTSTSNSKTRAEILFRFFCRLGVCSPQSIYDLYYDKILYKSSFYFLQLFAFNSAVNWSELCNFYVVIFFYHFYQ